jgi:hypothetical protein
MGPERDARPLSRGLPLQESIESGEHALVPVDPAVIGR